MAKSIAWATYRDRGESELPRRRLLASLALEGVGGSDCKIRTFNETVSGRIAVRSLLVRNRPFETLLNPLVESWCRFRMVAIMIDFNFDSPKLDRNTTRLVVLLERSVVAVVASSREIYRQA